MSVTNTPRKAGPYTGNGATVQYTFGFKVFADSDLVVTRAVIATGAESTLVLTTDYSVTRNADQDVSPGGHITLTAALADTYTLTLTSAVPDTQPAVFTNLGGFFPAVLNNALDRLTILVQQVKEIAGRSLKLPVSAPTGTSTTLPVPVGSSYLGWDATGTYLVNYSGLANVGVSTFMTPIVALTTAAAVRAAISAQVAGSYQPAGSYAGSGVNADITQLTALSTVPTVVTNAITAATPLASTTVAGLTKISDAPTTQTGTATDCAVMPADLHATILGGVGQTYQNLTASRSLGTNYTNSTGRMIEVSVWIGGGGAAGSASYVTGTVDGLDMYFATNNDQNGGAYNNPPMGLTMRVKAGSTYQVYATLTGGQSLNKWSELR